MSAISGTRRALKELADGTLRVQIDIDPRFKSQFHELFPSIDMPCAIAPLVADFEKLPQEKQKGGPLCTLAARWCKDPVFQAWLGDDEKVPTESECAAIIRELCNIESRSELDHNKEAERIFNEHFRAPFMNLLKNSAS